MSDRDTIVWVVVTLIAWLLTMIVVWTRPDLVKNLFGG